MTGGPKGRRLRSTLVVVQFVLSICMVIATVVVMQQMNYARTKDLGFDREHVLAVRLANWDLMSRWETLYNIMDRHPDVIQSATADDLPQGDGSNSVYHIQGQPLEDQIYISSKHVDDKYISTLGIELIAGRNFNLEIQSDTLGAVIINEAAARMLGYDDPIGTADR